MKTVLTLRLALPLVLFPLGAGAAPVRYDMNSSAELTVDAWYRAHDLGQSGFSSGLLEVRTTGYEEWMLDNAGQGAESKWWSYVNAERGWWFEAKLKVLEAPGTECLDSGPGLWLHDGTSLVKFTFRSEDVGFNYPTMRRVDFDPKDGFHVYRIQHTGRQVQALIDGQKVLSLELAELVGDGTQAVCFGDLGGCTASHVQWDYVAYDTAAPGTEDDDDDNDGIPQALDLCPDIPDDGSDVDHDRFGDVCDPCPNDPRNDADYDGLCGDVDVCPYNPFDPDQNANGICDDNECYGFGILPVTDAGSDGGAGLDGSSTPDSAGEPLVPPYCPPGCQCYPIDPVIPTVPVPGVADASVGPGSLIDAAPATSSTEQDASPGAALASSSAPALTTPALTATPLPSSFPSASSSAASSALASAAPSAPAPDAGPQEAAPGPKHDDGCSVGAGKSPRPDGAIGLTALGLAALLRRRRAVALSTAASSTAAPSTAR